MGGSGVSGCWMAKESRREAGELKVRNSFVGERSRRGLTGGEEARMRLPLMWERSRGSIDLRRR